MYEAYDYGHDTVILIDEENNISEGPGFNIFCVNETGLNSPNKGVLEGITRQTVLDLAKELNLPFQLSSISLEKLKSSNEVFATSTAGGIMPITKINGQLIGQGAPGEITRKLHKAYWDKHSDPSWSVSKEDLLK
jgi:branched-chain amino acid aminotransferase